MPITASNSTLQVCFFRRRQPLCNMKREALAALPKGWASAAEGRANGRTKCVYVTTLGVVAACFALFFVGATGFSARNRGARLTLWCCSSKFSTTVTDSLLQVTDFARAVRVADNCCVGAGAGRGDTPRYFALCSFCFISFFFHFASLASFSFRLFA